MKNTQLAKIEVLAVLIPKETKEAILTIREQFPTDVERKKRRQTEGTNKLRLTQEEKKLAERGFLNHFNKLAEYEKWAGNSSMVRPEFKLFLAVHEALDSYTRSMFACLRCGFIVPVPSLDKINGTLMHKCLDGLYGDGIRSSWLNLYATFIKNESYKKAILLLDERMEE